MTRFYIALGAVAMLVASCGDQGDILRIEAFVCGANGETYTVEEAGRAGHDVRHRGKCDDPMYCETPNDCFVGDLCVPEPYPVAEGEEETAIFPGQPEHYRCVPGPTRCNCPTIYMPVCGTDGRNYVNACEAACAGVEIKHEGYCEEPPGDSCVRGGCSDQLCLEEGMDIASTCEWKPVYECYQQATCERQQNGQCGFTPTHELVECLERHGQGMCEIDPRWQDGFTAECESEPFPGIVGIVEVTPLQTIFLGQEFPANFELIDPNILPDPVSGVATLFCDGEEVVVRASADTVILGVIEATCRILPESNECYSNEDCPPGQKCEFPWVPYYEVGGDPDASAPDIAPPGMCVPDEDECRWDEDCPPGHFCQHLMPWPAPAYDEPDVGIPYPPPGVCVDRCSVILCAPGYVCELGVCVPDDRHCRFDHDCPVGQICNPPYPYYDASRAYDPPQAGICEPCFCAEIYAPVCGVDGQTYGNACEARCAHVAVAYQGECESPPGDCVISGCSSQVCAEEPVATTCEWLPEYGCYQALGICERQPSGACSWTLTPELDECLSQFVRD